MIHGTDVVLRRGKVADVAFALAGLRVAQLWTPAENARSDSTRGKASDAPVRDRDDLGEWIVPYEDAVRRTSKNAPTRLLGE